MIKISSPPSFARVCLVGGETFSISGTASSSTEKNPAHTRQEWWASGASKQKKGKFAGDLSHGKEIV